MEVPFPSGEEACNHRIASWGGGSTNNAHEKLNDVLREAIFDCDHVSTSPMNDDASKYG